jgi:RHS repeat-associated protein
MGAKMLQAARRTGVLIALLIALCWQGLAFAQSSGTRNSGFAYDSTSGLLTQEVVEPGTPALRLQTDYTYDAFGNKIGATVSGVDISTRTAGTTYDAQGRFALSATNALGQSESWQYDARFGLPTSHTGPNGITTTWAYDSFGRKIQELRADGTKTQYTYQFCSGINGGTASCVSGGAYLAKVTSLAVDGVTPNAPYIITYFDVLDREVARDTQGFDGSIVRASKQYDSLGRVWKVSRPYFVSGGTPQWTTYSYDTLGRVISASMPDGTTTQNAYHGLTTSETNALSQTRTVTKNSRGEVLSVTDALSQTMTYRYDWSGNLVRTTDAAGNIVTATYDQRGRKITSNDPDMGAWTYTYNVLSQLTSQTDAKSQVSTVSYDVLGRTVQRVEPDMTSVWVYDAATHGVGKLASTSITVGPGAGFQRSVGYDTLGRPVQVATTIDSTVYTMAAAYDANGRLNQVSYPSGFVANYTYNSLGYANGLSDGAIAQTYWTANGLDAEGHLTQQTAGNGIVTNRSFSATNGRLLTVTAGTSNAVQNLSYTYDSLGNPLSRTDATSNLSESFTYDPLNRLLSATVSTNVASAKTFAYNAIGNLLSKSDVGTYTYAPPGSPQPHAVMSISGSTLSTTFTYDTNGNQTAGLGRAITWTSYNKPASITQGTKTVSFLDGTDHQRFKQVAPEGTTLYIKAFGVTAELVAPGTTAAVWNDYLSVGNVNVGMHTTQVTALTVSTRYFHVDHLGSIAVITDENGAIVERLSYDAWGKRRFPNGADDAAGSIESLTTRGFTGHETLDSVALVHMNGRVYDPLVARMVSADPTVPDAMNAQAWNRYSYVGNDPLTFTDPSGFSWLSEAFHAVANFLTNNPIVRAIATIVLAVVLAPVAAALLGAGIAASVAAAAASSAIVTGLSGGNLGQALRAGAIAGATALAFWGVGGATNAVAGVQNPFSVDHISPEFGTPAYAFNVASHAGVGCLSAVASGGQCGPGALSGGISAAATPLVNDVFAKGSIGGIAASAGVGGLASVAGGGKFENGAITGAFGYMFNQATVSGAGAGTAAGGGVFDALLGGVGRLLSVLALPLTLSGDTPQNQYLYHFTNAAGYEGITRAGYINLSADGFVYLTPTPYSSASLAVQQLALARVPTGYFMIPQADAQPFGPPTTVDAANGQPGGGFEIRAPHTVSVRNSTFVQIRP